MYLDKSSALLFVSLMLTACVSHESLPNRWALEAKESLNFCESVFGSYGNSGERGDQSVSSPAPVLSRLLIGSTATSPGSSFIRIEARSGKVAISVIQGSEVVETRIVKRECSSNRLKIPVPEPEGFLSGDGVVGYETSSFYLASLQDGSLAVRTGSFAVALVYFIPAFESATYWFKYPPFE